MADQKLQYMIVFTTDGEAKIVRATDELMEQQKAHQLARVASDDYADGLQRLKQNMASLSTPNKQLIQSQKQLTQQTARVNRGLKNTGKQSASTNNLIIAMTRGVQDAQYGMMGMANNIQQSAEMAAHAHKEYGSVKAVVGGLAGSLMNPATGLIIGVTALTTAFQLAQSGALDFSGGLIEVDEISQEYIETIDELIVKLGDLRGDNDIFSTKNLEARLAAQKNLQETEEQRLETLKEERSELLLIVGNALSMGKFTDESEQAGDRLADVRQQIAWTEAAIEKSKEKQTALEQQIYKTKQLQGSEQARMLDLQQQLEESTQKIDDILSKDKGVADLIAEDTAAMQEQIASEESLSEEMAAIREQSMNDLRRQGQARLQFERQMVQQRIILARQAGEEIQALELQKQQELRELENNELISERQRKEMRMMIIQEYANRELEIERSKQEGLLDLLELYTQQAARTEQYLHDRRVNMASMASDALRSINQAFFGDNKALSLMIFGVEKALAISNVLLDAKKRAAQAVMTGMALLSSPITAPLAGNAFAQAAAIKTTGLTTAALMGAMSLAEGAAMSAGGASAGRTGGFAGSTENRNPITTFRGIDADTVQGREKNLFPDTVKLTDSAGKFLTKLEFARDSEQTSGYVSS